MYDEKKDLEKLKSIIQEHKERKWALIPLLQKIQEEFGYIPPSSIDHIAKALKIFPSKVQGVVSFYAQFSMEPTKYLQVVNHHKEIQDGDQFFN